MSRQAIERDLVSRSEQRRGDVVAQLVLRQQQAALEQRLMQFHPADVAFVLEALPPDARRAAWELVRPQRRGAVLLELSAEVRGTLLATLPPEVGSLLTFPASSVGARMSFDFIAVRTDASLETVQALLRQRKPLPPHTTQLFAVDAGGVLQGLLPVQRLITEQPGDPVAMHLLAEPVAFYTDDPFASAVEAFERHELINAPVLNLHRQVVGRLTVDAVVDTIRTRAQDQRLEAVGLDAHTDLDGPLKPAARARWHWLALNLLTAFVASRVIAAFEDTITGLVALAALMPIVASIGGNTGNQTVALVIRGLALNQLGPQRLRRMFSRELAIAVYNGVAWGGVLGLATLMLYRSLPLALVIAGAMLLNLVVAAAAGVLAPVLLHRLGRDPVRGSSVILTAVTDSMGFLIFLSLAALLLV